MENSILTSTKKILNIPADYDAFDLDIITFINEAFSTLNQLGVGPAEGYMIEDATAQWSALNLPMNQLNMVRTYIYLKARYTFDPPGTSFALDAMKEQISEKEFRLTVFRDEANAQEEVV